MQYDEHKLVEYFADAPAGVGFSDLDLNNIPHHISCIMDGNGRWATARGLARTEGHKAGIVSLREIITACVRLGVDVLSAYAFSTENWNRAEEEGLLGKTDFVQAVWETVDLQAQGWQGAFDLTFASMCPGISNVDALLALCRASRKACFLTTFARRRDIVREQLGWQFFGDSYQAPWGKTLSYTVATLFAAGYYPEVTYQQENWQWEMSLDDAVRTYAPFFKDVCPSEEELAARLRASLLALARAGSVEERSESLIARVYWRVDEK